MRILLLPLLLFSFAIAQAQIIDSKRVSLPPFDSSKEIAKYATSAEFAEASHDKKFRYERILYRSADAVVAGYFYAPKKAKGRLPVIIFLRGNYVVHDQAPVLLTMFRRLARQGFIVFAPMLRGSDGTSGHDEMGGADLEDVRSAIDIATDLPHSDADNIFLYGESRGAMMTYFALREGWPVRAAAIFGGLTDIRPYLASIDPEEKFAAKVWPDYARNKEQILDSRSAIKWPEKIGRPLLIMHGGNDNGVPPAHSLRMAEALTELKKEYMLVVFADDNHILSRNRNRRDALAVEWFRNHESTSN